MKLSLASLALLIAASAAHDTYSSSVIPADGNSCNCQTATVTVTQTQTQTVYLRPNTSGVSSQPCTKTAGNGSNSEYANQPASSATAIVKPPPPSKTSSGARATFTVSVGGTSSNGAPNLVYNPPSLTAPVGSVIIFDFLARNHSVTESTFDSPCARLSGGFDSGFKPNAANMPRLVRFALEVDSEKPRFFYCAQKNPTPRCQAGMVFALNPESEEKVAQFVSNAKADSPVDTPSPPTAPSASASAPPLTESAPPNYSATAPKAVTTHHVTVGGKPNPSAAALLTYDPPTVAAKKGDLIEFNFRANAHTLTQSSFESPCLPLKGGINTGLQNNTQDIDKAIVMAFEITDDTKPLWFYCAAPTHCQQGMVFAVNDGGKFGEFEQRARANATAVGTRASADNGNFVAKRYQARQERRVAQEASGDYGQYPSPGRGRAMTYPGIKLYDGGN
jgi:plastocyanin